MLADNTQGLVITKQTKPRPVVSAALHPIIIMSQFGNFIILQALKERISVGIPYGPKNPVKISIYIEELSRNAVFFQTVGKP